MSSPTQRSKLFLIQNGYAVDICEHYDMFAHKRRDLFHMFDLVAVKDKGVLGVQTTTGSNASARVKKVLANPVTTTWVSAGNCIEIHGWRKLAKRKENKFWHVRVTEVKLQDGRLISVTN